MSCSITQSVGASHGTTQLRAPCACSGVRQSAKREHIPVVLDVAEFQRLLGELGPRERVLVWVSMTTGLRRGELAGLKWCDVSFELLRHGSAKVTVDVYAQAVIQAKRTAQGRVVASLRSEYSQSDGCVPQNVPSAETRIDGKPLKGFGVPGGI